MRISQEIMSINIKGKLNKKIVYLNNVQIFEKILLKNLKKKLKIEDQKILLRC